MAKVIGITSSQSQDELSFVLPKMYVRAIENVGGIPLIFPIIRNNSELIATMVDQVDGILLSGGVDVDPLLFGEEPMRKLGRVDPERDFFELEVARIALEKDKPILGICRGCQVLNIAAGGSIVQDIPSVYGKDNVFKHQQEAPRWHVSHTVDLLQDSKLAKIFETTRLTINSFHHQSVNNTAEGFRATANSLDGIIEAIEGIDYTFAVGVQWHPELLWERHPHFTKLFKSFVEACTKKNVSVL